MKRITDDQVDEVADILDRLRNDLRAVYDLDRRLAGLERPDGYRSSVRPMEGSPSSTDDAGDPLPPHSDPTGATVVALVDGRPVDAVRAEVATMTDAFAAVLREARALDGARQRAMTPDAKASTAPPGCRVHEGYGLGWEPVHASSRCRWCYDFALAQGVDPPKELVEKRSRGGRIFDADITRALLYKHSARSRKRTRRKAS